MFGLFELSFTSRGDLQKGIVRGGKEGVGKVVFGFRFQLAVRYLLSIVFDFHFPVVYCLQILTYVEWRF